MIAKDADEGGEADTKGTATMDEGALSRVRRGGYFVFVKIKRKLQIHGIGD